VSQFLNANNSHLRLIRVNSGVAQTYKTRSGEALRIPSASFDGPGIEVQMATRASIKDLRKRMSASIMGQEDVVENMVNGLPANGNILMEGLPGPAAQLS
jgi:hypothetical protein